MDELDLQNTPTTTIKNNVLKQRNPFLCLLFSLLTGGIFYIYWVNQTCKKLRSITQSKGGVFWQTMGLVFVPFFGLYWFYDKTKKMRESLINQNLYLDDNCHKYLLLSLFGLSILPLTVLTFELNYVAKYLPLASSQTAKNGLFVPETDESCLNKSINPLVAVILTIFTLGIYYLYWVYTTVKKINVLRKYPVSSAIEFACLIFIPFYCVDWFNTRSKVLEINAIKRGIYAESNSTEYTLLTLFGFSVLAYATMQSQLNFIAKCLPNVNTNNIRQLYVEPIDKTLLERIRNPIASLLLSLITFNIYGIYWVYKVIKTKKALCNVSSDNGAVITCYVCIPFYCVYFFFKMHNELEYCVNQKGLFVVNDKVKITILSAFLPILALTVTQSKLNYVLSNLPNVTDKNYISNTPTDIVFKKRNVALNVILSFLLLPIFSIYGFWWLYQILKRHNRFLGLPNIIAPNFACILFVPFYSIFWARMTSIQMQNKATSLGITLPNRKNATMVFCAFGLLPVTLALLQTDYNLISQSLPKDTELVYSNFPNETNDVLTVKQKIKDTFTTANSQSNDIYSDVLYSVDNAEKRLLKLDILFKRGLITPIEYQSQKNEILSQI